MKMNQKGFGHVAIVAIIVLVIGVIGFVGWRVVSGKDAPATAVATKSKVLPTPTPAPTTEKPVSWATFKNEEAGLKFEYPADWKSDVGETIRYDDGMFGGTGGTLTSPAGKKLTWVYQIIGGKGGDCTPNDGDVAFAPDNKCASKQFLSVEKAQSVTMNPSSTHRNMFGDSLYITHTKHLAPGANSAIKYQICLDPYYTGKTETTPANIPEKGTSMGLLMPCEYWNTGFNVKYEVSSEADFNSADAKTAEKIMKTFNSL